MPAGPYRITEDSASASIARRSQVPSPDRGVLADELVERAGRIRAASGAAAARVRVGALIEERLHGVTPLSCGALHLALEEGLVDEARGTSR